MAQHSDSEWHRILDGERQAQALRAVRDICSSLQQIPVPDRDPSLCADLALFYAYLAPVRAKKTNTRSALVLLKQAIASVPEIPLGPALYDGFAGVAWAVEHVDHQLSLGLGDLNRNIDEHLLHYLDHSPWAGYYDLISGLVGLGVYCIERMPRPAAARCLESIVDRLAETAEGAAGGVTWRTDAHLLPASIRAAYPSVHYNLGVAHGIPGVIALLGQILACDVATRRVRELLVGAVTWLLGQKLPEGSPCIFPFWVSPDAKPVASRSAWCYGDPGIAAALLVAARAAGEPHWEEVAREIAHSAARRPRSETGVVDAGLCHGAAGLAHLFNRLYQATGDDELKESALLWLGVTLEMRERDRGIGGYRSWDVNEKNQFAWMDDPHFLTGATGIGLALLAAISEIPPLWDRLLLCAIPPREPERKTIPQPGKRETGPSIVPSGFFAVRTPLLPFDDFTNWSADLCAPTQVAAGDGLEAALSQDRQLLRARLAKSIERPEVLEALYIASPSLYESLGAWQREPESKRGQKVEHALVRYFSRMTGRPTPFGLFAGCSVGQVAAATDLVIEGINSYRRRTLLDIGFLSGLGDALVRDTDIRRGLRFYPNSSLYSVGNRKRYIESDYDAAARSYRLVDVKSTRYLETAIHCAEGGATLLGISRMLAASEAGISLEMAKQYVANLVQNQILLCELDPAVTDPNPIRHLMECLRGNSEAPRVVSLLEQVQLEMLDLDAKGLGAEAKRYSSIASLLGQLPYKADLSQVFSVDLIKPAGSAVLGESVIREIVRGVEILRLFVDDDVDHLEEWRESFVRRYGEAEVPLVTALDDEVGIGFESPGSPTSQAAALLKGLPLTPAYAFPVSGDDRFALLLRKLFEAVERRQREVTLLPAELEELENPYALPLPDAFAVVASLAATSREKLEAGDFTVYVNSVSGPSGAILLGRFCQADTTLEGLVKRHLEAEEKLRPDAVFAELIHLPEGRAGNVVLRPVLHKYEIPYLGRSCASKDCQLPITDLQISVRNNRITLRSARLGCEVIPCLTTAHNFNTSGLPLYRFLSALQSQGCVSSMSWNWGPLESAPFLPRVRVGRLVLFRAQWLVTPQEIGGIGEKRDAEKYRAVQAWRAQKGLARFVLLADGDNELPIDLDNVLSIDSLVEAVRSQGQATLIEMYPSPDNLCVHGPEGRFTHQLVIPFVLGREPSRALPTAQVRTRRAVTRTFPPGSEWLYVKLYTGFATADKLICEVVRPLTRQALRSGLVKRWFFIRYADSGWHLRLRFQGEAQPLQSVVLPMVEAAFARALRKGYVWKMEIDTYEREIERYGGAAGVDLAEQIFHADSEAALTIVQHTSGSAAVRNRWKMTLLSTDMLLDDFSLPLETKYELVKGLRDGSATENGMDPSNKHLSRRFDQERKGLESLLAFNAMGEKGIAHGMAALQRRSAALARPVANLRSLERAGLLSCPVTELAVSFVHMSANRLLVSDHQAQELVLYDLLTRLYASQLARKRQDATGSGA